MGYCIKEKGFTLIEILIAMALLGILSTLVIPNITGYLSRGEEMSYNVNLKTIQLAVDSYYANAANRGTGGVSKGKKTYPLKGSEAERVSGGIPVGNATEWISGTGYFIDFVKIVGVDKELREIPSLASIDNGGVGSYSLYVTTAGKVESKWIGDRTIIGFVSGVYP